MKEVKKKMSECKFCKAPVNEGDLYCSKCGGKVELPQQVTKIPQMMEVKEATEIFFQSKVSQAFLYAAVREHRHPHVRRSGGKILLDVDELNKWWEEELQKSTVVQGRGLRKII